MSSLQGNHDKFESLHIYTLALLFPCAVLVLVASQWSCEKKISIEVLARHPGDRRLRAVNDELSE